MMIDFKYDTVETSKHWKVDRYYLGGVLVGKLCKICATAKPVSEFTLDSHAGDKLKTKCKVCTKNHFTEYRKNNSESMAAQKREWYYRNPEDRRAKSAQYKKDNPEQVERYFKESSDRNKALTPEEVAVNRNRRHPDGLKRCQKCRERLPFDNFHVGRVYSDHLQLICKSCAKKRGIERRTKKSIQYWESVGIDPTICFYCEFPIYEGDQLHSDHVIAEDLGGPDELTNQVPTCRSCNLCKRDKYFVTFLDIDFPYEEDQERILSKLRDHRIDWTLPRRETQ